MYKIGRKNRSKGPRGSIFPSGAAHTIGIAVCQNVVVGAFPTVHFTRKHDIHQNQVRSVSARLFNRVLTGHGDAGHFIGNPPRESQAAQAGISR